MWNLALEDLGSRSSSHAYYFCDLGLLSRVTSLSRVWKYWYCLLFQWVLDFVICSCSILFHKGYEMPCVYLEIKCICQHFVDCTNIIYLPFLLGLFKFLRKSISRMRVLLSRCSRDLHLIISDKINIHPCVT